MSRPFQPMLAPNEIPEMEDVKLPVLASPKLDGYRCTIRDGVALARSLEPIRNRHVQDMLRGLPDGLDGELIVGDPTAEGVFNITSSGVSKAEGKPDFTFYVFDIVQPGEGFDRRFGSLIPTLANYASKHPIALVPHNRFDCLESLRAYEETIVSQGYEGIMVRSLDGHYKFGRATMREHTLLKIKRWYDCEAEITGVIEGTTNTNEKTADKRGYAKRSTAKAGKVPNGMLGAVECRFPNGVKFKASGGTVEECKAWWAIKDELPGKIAKIKHMGLTPAGKPRYPGFMGVRDPLDMGGDA